MVEVERRPLRHLLTKARDSSERSRCPPRLRAVTSTSSLAAVPEPPVWVERVTEPVEPRRCMAVAVGRRSPSTAPSSSSQAVAAGDLSSAEHRTRTRSSTATRPTLRFPPLGRAPARSTG
ncbi:hypothetical protein ACFPRL_23275 [Pseudoclavibacter helvolus]